MNVGDLLSMAWQQHAWCNVCFHQALRSGVRRCTSAMHNVSVLVDMTHSDQSSTPKETGEAIIRS